MTKYLNEMGYQHFGLVMAISNRKAFVIPLTSNPVTYQKAYDPVENPRGKKNLMRIGLVDGLRKDSVLFLNDCRFINTARVINITTHIDPASDLFQEVEARLKEVLRI